MSQDDIDVCVEPWVMVLAKAALSLSEEDAREWNRFARVMYYLSDAMCNLRYDDASISDHNRRTYIELHKMICHIPKVEEDVENPGWLIFEE